MFKNFDELRRAAAAKKGKKIVICVAHSEESIEAVDRARKEGLVEGLFVGDEKLIRGLCEKLGVDPGNHRIVHCPDEEAARRESVRLVRDKEGDILMKGSTSTGPFLKAILDREKGIREGGLISHILVCKPKRYHKLLMVSDAGIVIAPTLEQKKMIIENAVRFAHRLGLAKPKVALLCALEKVNPDMPRTVEAAKLVAMHKTGELQAECFLEGPYALDNALSAECGRIKGIKGEVVGDADILICPDIEAGNILAKSILWLSDSEDGGMLVGTNRPVALLSRADTEATKRNTITLAVAIS